MARYWEHLSTPGDDTLSTASTTLRYASVFRLTNKQTTSLELDEQLNNIERDDPYESFSTVWVDSPAVMKRDPSADGHRTGASASKGMLFCVSCPHRAPFDGDWTVVRTDDSAHYLCPNCGTEVLTRHVSGSSDPVRAERPPSAEGRSR